MATRVPALDSELGKFPKVMEWGRGRQIRPYSAGQALFNGDLMLEIDLQGG